MKYNHMITIDLNCEYITNNFVFIVSTYLYKNIALYVSSKNFM